LQVVTDERNYPTCGAKKRQGEGHCTRPAGWGTDHPGFGACKLHGGKTQSHEVAAQKQEAKVAVEKFGLPREVDPHTALIEELHRSAGIVAFLVQQTQGLDTDDMHGPVGQSGDGHHARREAHVWIRMLADERDRLRVVAKTCVDVGIEERRVRLIEQAGELLATAIRGVLDEFGLLSDPRTPDIVRRHLAQLEAPAA
jgi:hypothetical protein